jgi:hypothetical protein
MKAITLIQPWASLIALGEKQFETRSWATNYRGPIAIHAGRRTKQAETFIEDLVEDMPYPFYNYGLYSPDYFPFGAIVAIANLVDCYETKVIRPHVSYQERDLGDWSPGRFAWEMSVFKVLDEPIPMSGKQGLWEVPATIEALLAQRIKAET